jgi:hypothetical protein
MGNMGKLDSLRLDHNQLSGGVPSELGNLVNLTSLLLGSNPLSGALPSSLTNLTGLTWFYFGDTNLCEPTDPAFQAWKSGVQYWFGTNIPCVPVRYSISGRVTTSQGAGVAGVTVSAGGGASAVTAANGVYTITNLITGTYTLVPSKSGYIFSPPSRVVTVPPNKTGADFTASGQYRTYLPLIGRE